MVLTRRLAVAALGLPFVWLGHEAVLRPGSRVAAAARLGVPAPDLAVRLNGLVMVVGGLALCSGTRTRIAAGGVAACLVPTTLAGHPFWTHDDPGLRTKDRINFLKNLGLMGGLAVVALSEDD